MFRRLREDYNAAMKRFADRRYRLVEPKREERTVEFKFRSSDSSDDISTFPDFLLQLPEVYPGGVALLTGPHGQSSFGGTVEAILERVIADLHARYALPVPEDLTHVSLNAPVPEAPKSTGSEEAAGSADHHEFVPQGLVAESALDALLVELAICRAVLGPDALVQEGGDLLYRVVFAPPLLEAMAVEVYGIHMERLLLVEIALTAPLYLLTRQVPRVTVSQCDPGPLAGGTAAYPFGLQWQCNKRIERFLHDLSNWPVELNELRPLLPKPAPGLANAAALVAAWPTLAGTVPLPADLTAPARTGLGPLGPGTGLRLDAIPEGAARHCVALRIGAFLNYCIATCNARCIICDSPLPYAGLRPTVCSSALCNFSYEQFSLGRDVAADVRLNALVVDMLISFAVSCIVANQHVAFDPFPLGVRVEAPDPRTGKPREYSFVTDGRPDFDKLRECFDAMPSLAEMRPHAHSDRDLREFLNRRHPLLFNLLSWLINSNRAHIKLLEPGERIEAMKTPYQFLMATGTPEKESAFRAAKREAGSHFAFHGSRIWNWHSILRMGLKNFSHTSRMTAGAAAGPGIYFARNSLTSFGYCIAAAGWPKSAFGKGNLMCIVMAEVINNPTYDRDPWGWVVPVEEHVLTRYFFVYPNDADGPRTSISVTATDFTPPAEEYYGAAAAAAGSAGGQVVLFGCSPAGLQHAHSLMTQGLTLAAVLDGERAADEAVAATPWLAGVPVVHTATELAALPVACTVAVLGRESLRTALQEYRKLISLGGVCVVVDATADVPTALSATSAAPVSRLADRPAHRRICELM